MRRLIISNTYYQLIMAIQMKATIFKDDYVCIMVSDHSNKAENVFQRLKKISFFDENVFMKSKGYIHNRSIIDKCKEFWQITFGKNNRYGIYLNDLKSLYFDEIVFFNLEIDMYGIYSILSRYNEKLLYSSYEEGVLSYENIYYDSLKFKIIRFLRKITNRPNITDNHKNFYCVYPELYNGNLNAKHIPEIDKSDNTIKNVLAEIFNLNSENLYDKYKYIFFETIYETEGYKIGELELFKKIAKILGKDNILVKKHPRSNITYYEENGFAVDTNSDVPFEAIQLNYDMHNCTFITTVSGSVLSVNSILNTPSQVYMCYRLIDYDKVSKIKEYICHVEKVITILKKNGRLKQVRVINDIKELQDVNRN